MKRNDSDLYPVSVSLLFSFCHHKLRTMTIFIWSLPVFIKCPDFSEKKVKVTNLCSQHVLGYM